MPAPEKIAALRRLLAGRSAPAPDDDRVLATGLPAFDEAAGGLPLGAVTEVVCGAPSCGGHLLLGQLLAATRAARARVALVDAADSFDPESFPTDLLAHLVWVRCPGPVNRALQAADLLARDANLGLIVLDLRRAPAAGLDRTPASFWHRLRLAVEPAGPALVVETPHATVPCARLRLALEVPMAPGSLARARPALAARLTPVFRRQRLRAAG